MNITRKQQLDQIERSMTDLANLKARLVAEQVVEDAEIYKQRMERYKALECHFVSTDYPLSNFRWSTAKRDTIKLELIPYKNNGKYEGGLYETGPSFKLIVGLLQVLDDASQKTGR